MTLKANTRMYNLTPAVEAAWGRLVAAVSVRADVPLSVLDHPAPRPVEDLWARPDLGLVMMCGWPFARATPQPVAIAAPVMATPDARDAPIYWSNMIVAATSEAKALEDTFGGTLAWTVEGSHSGYNAPRTLLLPHFRSRGPLFRQTVGPVVTPRGAIEAVTSGRATLAPLDAYAHALLALYEPETASKIRTVAKTPDAPIPLFTASPGTDATLAARLADALVSLPADEEGRALLADLCLNRFTRIDPSDYDVGERWHAEAVAAGYARPR
ncbi:MAG: PhnD/SsuA/transferrin family substrate-binding protein [Pseudomonadota bacterium]